VSEGIGSLVACLLAVVLLPLGKPSPVPVDGPTGDYVVQPGDTLYGIATRCHTTVSALAQINGRIAGDDVILSEDRREGPGGVRVPNGPADRGRRYWA